MYFVKNFRVGQFSGPTRGLSNHTLFPRSPPRSDRFKFLLHKHKGAPMCFVKNFRVGQFLRNTWGLPLRFHDMEFKPI